MSEIEQSSSSSSQLEEQPSSEPTQGAPSDPIESSVAETAYRPPTQPPQPDSMPKFTCHKVVEAMKIAEVKEQDGELFLVGEDGTKIATTSEWMRKHDMQPGATPESPGYWVRYDTGYTSWSPTDAFERGYTPNTERQSVASIDGQLYDTATGYQPTAIYSVGATRLLIKALAVAINGDSSARGRGDANDAITSAENALAGYLTPLEVVHLDTIFEYLISQPAVVKPIAPQPDPEDLSPAPEPK